MPRVENLHPIIDGLIGNPFDTDDDLHERAAARVETLDVAKTLRHLLGAGSAGIEQAKLLVLSVGHLQACRHPDQPDRVLDAKTVPKEVAHKLPRPLSDYLRIAMAAGRAHHALRKVLGNSSIMNRTRRAVWAACFGHSLRHALDLERVIRDHDVLLLGETGTGKELVAAAIGLATPGGPDGSPAPRNAINAAAIPETLVESELFGHIKGAFTGATDTRVGRLRSADRGCFFLDEIGDLPSTTQVKLLRVIETNEIFPVGSDATSTVDIRYVAATHKDLGRMVEEKKFRKDLFQRIAGNVIRLPPLRERPDDIVDIGMAFVESYLPSVAHGVRVDAIDHWLHSSLAQNYDWPGNVRELQNALRDLLLGLEPTLESSTAEPGPQSISGAAGARLPARIRACRATLQDVSDWYLKRVLDSVEGNFTKAAKILGVDRSTVRRRATDS